MLKTKLINTLPNKDWYFKSYNYAKVYLFVSAILTYVVSNIALDHNLVEFNYPIQLLLSGLYCLGFIGSLITNKFNKHLFTYTFIIITLSACSITYILFQNSFSPASFLIFLISLISVIFVINSIPRFLFFLISFSLIYLPSLLISNEIIIGTVNAFIIYIVLVLTAYFIVFYRVSNINKGKTRQNVFDYFFKYSSDILVLAKLDNDKLIIKDFNSQFQSFIGVTSKELLTKSKLDEIEVNQVRIFNNIDLKKASDIFKVKISSKIFEIRYDSFQIKNDLNFFISIVDITRKIQEKIDNQLTIDSYKFLYENSFELICISDVDGDIIACNSSLSERTGYSSSELIGKNIADISVKENTKERKLVNKSVFENGGYKTLKKEIISKTNEIIPIEVIIRRGKYFGKDVLISTARDISERLLSEKKIKESEYLLNQIYENAPVIMYTEDENGLIIQVNKLFLEVLGFEKKEIIGKSFSIFLTDDCKNLYTADKLKLNEAKFTIQCNNKEVKNVLIDSINLEMNSDLGNINLFVVHDVTELYTYQKVLANSVERFTNLFENAPIAMAIATEDNRLLDFNKSFLKLFGYSSDELLTMSLYDFCDVDDIPDHEDELKRLRSSNGLSFESKFTKKNGNVVYTIKKIILDRDDYQNITRKIIQIVDITSQVESRLILNKKQEILDLTLSASQTILWDLDIATGNAIWRNIYSVTGYSEETLYVNRELFKQFIYHEDYEFVMNSLKEMVRQKKSYTIDFRLVKKDGEIVWINSRGEVNLDEYDNPTNIYGIMQDITRNKEYEHALELSELKYKQLFERNLSGVYRTSYDGHVIDCNPAFAKILGYNSVDELLSNKESFKFYKNLEVRENILNELIKNKSLVSKRIELVKKDRSTIHILLSATVIYNELNEIDYIEGNIIDINDLVLTERNLELTKQQYKDLIDYSSFGILIIHNKVIQFINSKGIEILKYKQDREVLNKNIFDVIGQEDNLLDDDINFVTEGNSLGAQDRVFIDHEDNRLDVEIRVNKITYNEKESLLITFIDVTSKKQIEEEKKRAELAETSNALLKAEIQERIKVENKLTLAQSYTNGIIESSIDMIYTAGINGSINEFNTAALKEFGYKKSEIIGESLTVLFANEKECNSVIHKLEENGQFVGEIVSKRKDNSLFISYLSVSYLFNTKGIVMGIMAISRDITELKLAEEELKKSEEKNKLQAAKLNTIIESSSHYFFTVNKRNRIVSFNLNFKYDIESLTHKEIHENDDFFKVMGINDKKEISKWKRYFDIGFSGEHFYFENEQMDLNNNIHYREVFINPIKKENGVIDELSFIGRDITEKKLAERNLKESLKQKEILLKEVHHRVKNNMQVISSILNLQSAFVKDTKTLQILKESQNRIKSMAFIHESLYTHEDFSRIDFSEYITNLVRNLFRTYDVFDDKIVLELQIDKIYLNLDSAIPCGLIVNELISNSLKYAFDIKTGGIIKIMLTLENEFVVLAVGDNGKGIPKELDIENTETLGLQLISSLVEQLEGQMHLDRENGTNFIIKFKMN